MSIAVFISGNGSNLQALIDYKLPIAFVASNNPNAYGLTRAEKANIKTYVEPTPMLKNFEKMAHQKCKEHGIKLIVLAGFMRILSQNFVNKWENKIINIHPSLLPAFKGKDAIKQAWDYGVKITGVTIHFVDQGVDTGPIIEQEFVYVHRDDTLKNLEEKIHKLEHTLLPPIVKRTWIKILDDWVISG